MFLQRIKALPSLLSFAKRIAGSGMNRTFNGSYLCRGGRNTDEMERKYLPFRVKAASFLQDFSYDRDSAVYWVANHANESFGAVLRDCGG